MNEKFKNYLLKCEASEKHINVHFCYWKADERNLKKIPFISTKYGTREFAINGDRKTYLPIYVLNL